MGRYLNVGNAGFTAMTRGMYVDKTELIAFINGTLGTTDKLTCVSRPRRFGKSFAAKMLCAYYDKSCDSRALFEKYRIAEDESFERYLNKYDVLCLDITHFISRAPDIRSIVKDINALVTEEVHQAYPDVKREAVLSDMLYSVAEATGNKFIVIIDEWDALFREAKDDPELHKEYIYFLRGLFKNSGQTDKMIEAAYMTGILPIKKYGHQSAVSDFREYTMIAPRKLARFTGFTEDEVKELCRENGMDFQKMKFWYDGYSFRRLKSVYNPESVMEAIKNEEFGSYWTRTETYESLKIYIELNEDGLREAIVQMLGGGHIKINAGSFQNDMTSIKVKDDVLTLLVHLGYLTYDAEEQAVFIPNEEVRQEFLLAVTTGRHREVAKMIRNSDRLLEQTLQGNEEAVAAAIEEAHAMGAAPLFYNNEQALRSVIRFAYLCCVDEYLRFEELPSGKGYADIVYFPKRNSDLPLLLIELKWDKEVGGAIRQVKERNYPMALRDYGGDILLVGISYEEQSKKHSCRIERVRQSR